VSLSLCCSNILIALLSKSEDQTVACLSFKIPALAKIAGAMQIAPIILF